MAWEIKELVKKYQDKDFIEIHKSLTTELKELDRIYYYPGKDKHISSDYKFKRYRDHAGDFLFFLNTGMVPATIGRDGLKQFLPIIRNLVKKGNLDEDVLNIFK
jgi:hypothetical protein